MWASASAFAAVPLKTKNTAQSVSNKVRIRLQARSVHASSPYPGTCPSPFARRSISIASGHRPALLSEANCCDMQATWLDVNGSATIPADRLGVTQRLDQARAA